MFPLVQNKQIFILQKERTGRQQKGMRSSPRRYTLNSKSSCSASRAQHGRILDPKGLGSSIPHSLDGCSPHCHTSGLRWLWYYTLGSRQVFHIWPSSLLGPHCSSSFTLAALSVPHPVRGCLQGLRPATALLVPPDLPLKSHRNPTRSHNLYTLHVDKA